MIEKFAVAALALTVTAGAAGATTLSAQTSVDNGYEMYLSTDDNVQGTLFAAGNNWYATMTDSVTLVANVTNYLHIHAYDQGGIASMLGQFTLSDAAFKFANNTQTMLTGDAGLKVSTSGWSGYGATTQVGPNGVGPWGYNYALPGSAQWVWSIDPQNDNSVYFTAAIFSTAEVAAVPVPAALPLLLTAFGGLGLATRRRRKSA